MRILHRWTIETPPYLVNASAHQWGTPGDTNQTRAAQMLDAVLCSVATQSHIVTHVRSRKRKYSTEEIGNLNLFRITLRWASDNARAFRHCAIERASSVKLLCACSLGDYVVKMANIRTGRRSIKTRPNTTSAQIVYTYTCMCVCTDENWYRDVDMLFRVSGTQWMMVLR